MRVLLTGFGPFPGAPTNPSANLVRALARRRRPALSGAERRVHVFATCYAAVDRDLPKLFAARPDVVLMFGLAGRRRGLSIETRARNARSLLFPDASGHRPPNGVIAAGEPAARRGGAPFSRLLSAARGTAFPARLSRDAGRYICNYLYWRALGEVRNGRPLVAFIHIPPIRRGSRRRAGRNAPPFIRLLAASETLLIALIAAQRRQSC